MKSLTASLPKFALGFLALVTLAVVSPVRADDAKPRKVTPATKQYDLDGDGYLNEAEQAKAREGARAKAKATRQEDLAKYDTNKDGKLDDNERAKRKADRDAAKEARRAEKLAEKESEKGMDKDDPK